MSVVEQADTEHAPTGEFLEEDEVAKYKKKWAELQTELAQQVVDTDTHPWIIVDRDGGTSNETAEEAERAEGGAEDEEEDAVTLTLVGGVDISFVKESTDAVAAYVVLSYPELEVVYEAYEQVQLTLPYISGYLAFRECGFLVDLVRAQRESQPELTPQMIMVDGNGVLHPRRLGLASQMGVYLDMPTLGVAKSFLQVDGMGVKSIRAAWTKSYEEGNTQMPLVGKSGTTHGMAVCSSTSRVPTFISQGHLMSLDTAVRAVQQCSLHRIPEPVRQADLRSRDYVRKHFPDSG